MRAQESEPFGDRCRMAGQIGRAAGVAYVLASDPATVRWLSGLESDIEWGPPYPFSAGIFVLLDCDGIGAAICPEDDPRPVPASNLVRITYEAYATTELRPYLNASKHIPDTAPLGIEADACSVAIVRNHHFVDLGRQLRRIRMVKDSTEVRLMREVAAIASEGQQAFRTAARAGRSEISIFSAVHSAMEEAAGERVPVLADLLSGSRLVEVGRPPSGREVMADDLVLCDLAPRYHGYWADSCTTICVGSPSNEMHRLHEACLHALSRAVEATRPGLPIRDLDAQMRQDMRAYGYEYPHHSGHGLGVGYHEEPRIVPDATGVLRSGMVLALEPAGFTDDIGMRLEQVVLVRDNGAEILTNFPLSLTL